MEGQRQGKARYARFQTIYRDEEIEDVRRERKTTSANKMLTTMRLKIEECERREVGRRI